MLQPIVRQTSEKMQEILDKFSQELRKIRTGRADTALVEGIRISYYGQSIPLGQLAQIGVEGPTTIRITPFDKNSSGDIELGIRNSDLGLSPVNDGQNIRLNLPPLTSERRQQQITAMGKIAEEARISLRNIREESWKKIQSLEREGKLTEDDRYSGEEELNKSIDNFNQKLKQETERKEKEIRTL